MAVEKQVNIKVTESGVDELAKKFDKLDSSMESVEVQSKKTSKSVDDVAGNGGAIAILDSLTGGLATRFRDAYEASRLFNISLKGMRTALIATGIGALVVALGLVVAYWDDIVDYITGANEELQKQIDLSNDILDNLDFELKLLDEKEKILKLEGKSTKEIRKQKEAVLLLQQEENALLLENLKTQLAKEKAQIREVTLWEKIKIAAANAVGGVGAGVRQTALSTLGSEEEQTRLNEITEQIQESTLRAQQLKLALLQLNQPDTSSGAGGSVTRGKISGVGGLKGKGAVSPRLQAELDENTAILASRSQLAQDIIRTNELIAQSDKEEAENRMKLEEAVAQAKVDIASNTLALIGEIAGEGSSIAKGVAVAQATISGIEGVQNAYTTAAKSPITTLFPAYPIIQAGLAGAFSAIQIKKILSTDPSGKSTPNLGAGGGGGQTAPAFNLVGQSGVNQLAESLQGQNEPVQAYVVGSNVTSQQALDRNIVQTATIG